MLAKLMVLLLLIPIFITAQAPIDLKLDDTLPQDENVITGKLENGLRYFIRKNGEPQKRAELRLVIKTGSIMEDDDQRGLAHFTEHMAFNGTKNFHKQALVSFLEKSGMRFGADVNAYTSFDETVYMLQLPTDSVHIFETGFQVLEDWAHNLSFDPEEIEKERGVVIEEWRIGQGAGSRIRDKQFPILFNNSKYAERLPIGKKEILENFKHETLTRFYKDWYRPDLMAVVAVGDFDTQKVESLIKSHFAKLSNPHPEKPRLSFPVPGHEETLFAIATDPEQRFSRLALYTKIDVSENKTVADYRREIVKGLYSSMLNQRLSELTQKSDPPFLAASSGESRIVDTRAFYTMNAVVNENKIEAGLDALLTEAERVKLYGFTKSELEREKKSTLRGLEQAMREYDKRKSRRFASEYIRAFLEDEPFPGLAYEFEIYKKYIPGITLEEVNNVGALWAKNSDRVVLISLPEKEGVMVPKEESLLAEINAVKQKKITPYADVSLDKPIVELPAGGSKIVKEKAFKDVGVTEWELANGVKVVLKPTDFKNDQILFSASSPGGSSLIETDDLIAGETADVLIRRSGVGNYNFIGLQKYLADKVAGVSPYIGSISEGFSGSASPQDLEILLQLTYAYFTHPRMEEEAFSAYTKRMEAILKNRDSNPGTAFNDTLSAVLSQHNPRSKPMVFEDISKMDMQLSEQIFKQRFADGNDFRFFFVGNFTLESIRPLVEKYLGALPIIETQETWQDRTFDYPKGVLTRKVYKGLEPKSQVALVFTGDVDWNPKEQFILSALADVLRIKLREHLREDKGGTYGVGVRASYAHFPKERYRLSISFGANPERVEELKKEVFVQIDSLKNFGTTQEYLDKVTEIKSRNYETNLRENRFWLGKIEAAYFHNLPLESILNYPKLIEGLSLQDIQDAAKKFLDTQNYIDVVLYPENWGKDK